MTRVPSYSYQKFKKEKCELCGSEKTLEVHHIFPLQLQDFCSAYSNSIDLNTEENCITVCSKCHGLLTNRSLATKIGQACFRWKQNSDQKIVRFYETLNEIAECGDRFDEFDVLDIFDSIFFSKTGAKE